QYYPMHPEQRVIQVVIYQGEARMVKDNIKLGELRLALTAGAAESNGVDVRFTYDVNGLLEVEATLHATGDTTRLVIEGNPGLLTEQDIRERCAALAELKIHPRDRIENRTLLARAERLYQQLRGNPREWLGMQIRRFEQVLETQDRSIVAPAARGFR